MKKVALISLIFGLTVLMAVPMAFAQNPASNKAFFASNPDGVKFAVVSGDGWSAPVTLFYIPEALKTSNVGAVSAILSMEAALWTYNVTTDINLGGKSSSSSRAAIKAWVEVDGVKMEPGKVVYADRLQATGLDVNLFCTVTPAAPIIDPDTGLPIEFACDVTGDITLELFQRTKNANSFVFFLGPLDPKIHSVVVKAQALVECRSNGDPIACPKAILDGYKAKTAAAIGKATLLIEEHNNWGIQY
jgi:hypothetical protein